MNTNAKTPRPLGYWLRSMMTQKTYSGLVKFDHLARFVCCLYTFRVITKRTFEALEPCVLFFGDIEFEDIDTEEPKCKKELYELLYPVLEFVLRMLATDEKLKAKGFATTEELLQYLDIFEVPHVLYNADVDKLLELLASTFHYVKSDQTLLYVDDEVELKNGRKIWAVREVDMRDEKESFRFGMGRVVYSGVNRMYYRESDNKLLLNMENLKGVLSLDPVDYESVFLPYCDLISTQGEECKIVPRSVRLSQVLSGKIGWFSVQEDGTLGEYVSEFVCDGTYDLVSERMVLNAEEVEAGAVYYDCKKACYAVCAPLRCSMLILDEVKEVFKLEREEILYRFYDDEFKPVVELMSHADA